MLNRRAHLVLLPLVLLLFALGVAHLFELRFSRGDFYPPYSSLRADPLGTKALYQSLDQSGLHETDRFFEPTPKLGGGADTTLLVLGTEPAALRYLPIGERKLLEEFVFTGGHIVIALHPYLKRPYSEDLKDIYYEDFKEEAEKRREKNKKKKKAKPKEDSKDKEKNRRRRSSFESLLSGWEFNIIWGEWGTNDAIVLPSFAYASPVASEIQLPLKLPWRSAMLFNLKERDDWDVLYETDGHPVMVRRAFGKGSLILLSDSYVFSNEALRDGRETRLLAWFFGERGRVLFDETHLGVANTEGVATLARKYRLHGLAAGLLLLAILFVWRSATSLVPPHDDVAVSGAAVTGRHSQDGFVNLLRRSIRPAHLLATCHAEWRAVQPHEGHRTAAVRQVFESADEKPTAESLINRYRAACRAIKSPPAKTSTTNRQSIPSHE